MPSGFFITGTDTDCGKTLVTLGLMQALQARGDRVAGMKPVAAGADQTADGWRNTDALQIQAQETFSADYTLVNPYLFEPPIAPHLAAKQAGVVIDFNHISRCCRQLVQGVDQVIVEGAGGWLVPLSDGKSIADLALHLGLPVILVVGLKLGCINHALLSVESIRASGAKLAGWIGNHIDPDMREQEANVETLKASIDAPCLGVVPYMPSPSVLATSQMISLP